MTVFIDTNKDALQTWLADFLSSNIAVSGRRRRLIARSDHESEKQVHGDAESHRESVRRDNESEIGIRLAHLNENHPKGKRYGTNDYAKQRALFRAT
jgi:hypothetical protein